MRAAIILILLGITLAGCTKKQHYMEPPVSGEQVVIPVSSLMDMKPAFYSLTREGKRYDFFVQSVKGEVAAYIDACFKCAPKQKGFRVEDGKLHCNACGESFRLDSLSGIGSCYPLPLSGEVKGADFHISIEEIVRKTRFPL